MIDTPQPIALFGGTFDPIHLGHIHIALEIQQAYQLADVRFMPSWQPVHRDTPSATAEQRLAMLALALEYYPTLTIDDCEIQRQGPSYTIDTLEGFRKKFPNTPLCLILGVDAWLGFTKWHRYQDILNIAHLIIATRPHYELPQTGAVATLLQNHLTEDPTVLRHSLGGKIIFHDTTDMDVSASEIRELVAMNHNVETLLPPGVYDYIVNHHLYSEKV